MSTAAAKRYLCSHPSHKFTTTSPSITPVPSPIIFNNREHSSSADKLTNLCHFNPHPYAGNFCPPTSLATSVFASAATGSHHLYSQLGLERSVESGELVFSPYLYHRYHQLYHQLNQSIKPFSSFSLLSNQAESTMATQSMSPLDAINLVKSPCEMQAKPPVVMDAHVPVIASTVSYRLADNTCAIDQLPVNSSFKMCNVTNVINNTNQQQQQDSAIHLKAGHLPSGTCSNTKSSGPSDTISPVNKSPNGVYQRDRESPFSSLDEGIDLEDIEECSSKSKQRRQTLYQCTWRGCNFQCLQRQLIEQHVRVMHLGRSKGENNASQDEESDREEEFYYNEMEIDENWTPSRSSTVCCVSPIAIYESARHAASQQTCTTSIPAIKPICSVSHQYLMSERVTSQTTSLVNGSSDGPIDLSPRSKLLELKSSQASSVVCTNSSLSSMSIMLSDKQSSMGHSKRFTCSSSCSSASPVSLSSCSSSAYFSSSPTSSTKSWSHSEYDHEYGRSNVPLLPMLAVSAASKPPDAHHSSHLQLISKVEAVPIQESLSISTKSNVIKFGGKEEIVSRQGIRLQAEANNTSTTSVEQQKSTNSPQETLINSIEVESRVEAISKNRISQTDKAKIITSQMVAPRRRGRPPGSTNKKKKLLQSQQLICSMSPMTGSQFIASFVETGAPSEIGNSKHMATLSHNSSTISPIVASLNGPYLAPVKSFLNASRKARGESRKCRKVYGMDNRDLWCTQCKWKKACSRFLD